MAKRISKSRTSSETKFFMRRPGFAGPFSFPGMTYNFPMRIVPVLFFVFSFSAFAQSDVVPLLNVLENPAPDARICTQEDFQSCVTALCGDRSRYQRRQDADYEALYDARAFGSIESVTARIRATLERQRLRNIEFAREFKSRIAAGTYSLNTSSWDEFMWDNKAHEMFANHIEWEFDRTQPADRKITFRLTGTDGRSPAFRNALEVYAREELQNRIDHRSLLYNYLLTENELRDSIAESQKIAGDLVTQDLRNRINRGEDLQNLARDLFNLRPENGPIQMYNCRSTECRSGLAREISSQLVPGLTKFEESNQRPEFVDQHLPQCLSSFIQSAVRAPESEAMLASMPAMRERYINSALSNLSAHSKDTFKKYLDEEVDYSTNLMQNPRTSLDTSFAEAGRPYPAAGVEILLKEAPSSGPKDKMNPLLGLDVCAGPSFLESDSFLPNSVFNEGKDLISLSGFNCAHPDLGEGVFLHELGHALSFVMRENRLSTESRATYLSLRDCIRNAGPNLPGSDRFSGDKLTTEEDMADFLAAKVPTNASHPSSCQLQTNTNLMEMDQGSRSHSSATVRLLRDARARGPLPPSCLPIFNQFHSQFQAETCSQ